MHDLSDMDIVRAVLADALASGLTLQDALDAATHADCLLCWDDAVGMLGIGAIDTTQFRFELNFKE